METLAALKRRCTPGTVVEVERLRYKPGTYLAVVAEHKERHCGLVTVDRAQVGNLDWSRARDWQFTAGTATQYSRDEAPVPLLRLRFLSEDELADLPEDVKQLSQKWQPEPDNTATVPSSATVVGSQETDSTAVANLSAQRRPQVVEQATTATLKHHGPYIPATAAQRAARIRPIAQDDTTPVMTEDQFWDAQKTVHQTLLELSEAAPPRQASYTVSTIRFHDHPQIEVRDVRVGVTGDWQATLVVHQPDALWLYALAGDLNTYHPERLSLAAATEKRVRRVLDSSKTSMQLRAVLKGIQQLPTVELRSQALLLLNENTLIWLTRYTQKPLLIDLAKWLNGLEIVVEPPQVSTTDGFVLQRQSDGSYSDGDLTYESLQDLDSQHDWEEIG